MNSTPIADVVEPVPLEEPKKEVSIDDFAPHPDLGQLIPIGRMFYRVIAVNGHDVMLRRHKLTGAAMRTLTEVEKAARKKGRRSVT
jgi:hypothetical protein